jgi:hypothetical protein
MILKNVNDYRKVDWLGRDVLKAVVALTTTVHHKA